MTPPSRQDDGDVRAPALSRAVCVVVQKVAVGGVQLWSFYRQLGVSARKNKNNQKKSKMHLKDLKSRSHPSRPRLGKNEWEGQPPPKPRRSTPTLFSFFWWCYCFPLFCWVVLLGFLLLWVVVLFSSLLFSGAAWSPPPWVVLLFFSFSFCVDALATRAGVECVAHVIQTLTDVDPEATVLSVDGVGAFDLISRASMLKGGWGIVGGDSVLPFVSQFYSSASTYIWEDDLGVTHEIIQGESGE